jgi:hypothetical protein
MIIGQTSGFSRTIWQWRGTRITAPLRSSAHHQRSYVENRGATVEKKPQLPSHDDLFRSFREQTEAAQQQWRERLAHDPASFARLEVEVHDHFRRLADLMTASLLAQTTMAQDQAMPGKKGVPSPATPRDGLPNSGS